MKDSHVIFSRFRYINGPHVRTHNVTATEKFLERRISPAHYNAAATTSSKMTEDDRKYPYTE